MTKQQKFFIQMGRNYLQSSAFIHSREWKRLRYRTLAKRGVTCECCGAGPNSAGVIVVDHIKPRKKFPELALAPDNLQVLCTECNLGKGSWDQTDWRKVKEKKVAYVEDKYCRKVRV